MNRDDALEDYLVELSGIHKEFPGVKALDGVSFNLKPGEVHALLGENGAGKSTLMKIMSGIYELDSGQFLAYGNDVGRLSPKKAQDLGITIIHQELNMCSHLTVAENMFLGREKTKHGIVTQKSMDAEAAAMLKKLNIDISPQTIVGKLSISKQQMVEIAKALLTDSRIIIMDEPTSALTEKEIQELFIIIKELRNSGRGIVYISHRLDELEQIVDRVTVLRDGKHVKTIGFEDTNLTEIISWMVGREITEKYPRVQCIKGERIMEVRELCAGKLVKNISFELYKGEIVGFAGLMGAGRTELCRAIFGADKTDSGEILIYGKRHFMQSPAVAIYAGVACVPEDRKREGLCVKLSIRENISLANMEAVSGRLGVINHRKERELASRIVQELKIKTPSFNQEANNLSGGNQQKVVVGKWLARNAKLVIFDEPTRGIDVASKVEIYNLMNKLKESGVGVIFVSSELPEILGMSDRVIVMAGGRITGELSAEDATQDKILRLATKFGSGDEEVKNHAG